MSAAGTVGEFLARAPVALRERCGSGALVAVGGLLEHPAGGGVVSAGRGEASEQVGDRADVACTSRGNDHAVRVGLEQRLQLASALSIPE